MPPPTVILPTVNDVSASTPVADTDSVALPLVEPFSTTLPPVPPLVPSVRLLVPVIVVPATVAGVVAPTVPLNAPPVNVPPVTVLPVNVSALGSESVGVVVPVTVISFAVPVMLVTAAVWEKVLITFGLPVERQDLIGMFANADSP